MNSACVISGCDRPIYVVSRGLCSVHYNRTFTHGTSEPEGLRIVGNDLARFWSKVEKTDNCWGWKGKTVSTGGYPQFSINRRQKLAHRISYEWFVGPIPEGFEVDHLCRNIRCVNPAHLEAVTGSENLRRQQIANGRFETVCSLPDCNKPNRSNGYCNAHYFRWKRHGDPYAGRPSYS